MITGGFLLGSSGLPMGIHVCFPVGFIYGSNLIHTICPCALWSVLPVGCLWASYNIHVGFQCGKCEILWGSWGCEITVIVCRIPVECQWAPMGFLCDTYVIPMDWHINIGWLSCVITVFAHMLLLLVLRWIPVSFRGDNCWMPVRPLAGWLLDAFRILLA